MPPEFRIFKPEYALELLRIAESDLDSAHALFEAKKGRLENVLFLTEQVVEKALKAVLCYQGKPVPLTHQLYIVISQFPNEGLPPGGYALNDLTPFATIRRYEEGKVVLTREEVTQALFLVAQVLSWAKGKINEKH